VIAVHRGRNPAKHIIEADPAVLSFNTGNVRLKAVDGIDRQKISQLIKNYGKIRQSFENGFNIWTNLKVVPFFCPFVRNKALDPVPAGGRDRLDPVDQLQQPLQLKTALINLRQVRLKRHHDFGHQGFFAGGIDVQQVKSIRKGRWNADQGFKRHDLCYDSRSKLIDALALDSRLNFIAHARSKNPPGDADHQFQEIIFAGAEFRGLQYLGQMPAMDFWPNFAHLLFHQGIENWRIVDHVILKKRTVLKCEILQDRVAKPVDRVNGGRVERIQCIPDFSNDAFIVFSIPSRLDLLKEFFLNPRFELRGGLFRECHHKDVFNGDILPLLQQPYNQVFKGIGFTGAGRCFDKCMPG